MQFEGFTDVTTTLRAGVYILVHLGHVVYVGQSKTMLNRVYQHRCLWGSRSRKRKLPNFIPVKGIPFNEVHVMPCRVEELDLIERSLIQKYNPKYNIKHKPYEREKKPLVLNINGLAITLNAKTLQAEKKSEFVRRV